VVNKTILFIFNFNQSEEKLSSMLESFFDFRDPCDGLSAFWFVVIKFLYRIPEKARKFKI